MTTKFIKFNSTEFDSTEFNISIGDKYFIGTNYNDINVIFHITKNGAVFTQDLQLGILFESQNSANDFIDENSTILINVIPIKVSDVMRPVYYVKKLIAHYDIPSIRAAKLWMDKECGLGEGMFLDQNEAQNSLDDIRHEVIGFYHQKMILALDAKF